MLTSKRASIILDKVADDASSIYFSSQNESLLSRMTSIKKDEEDLHMNEVDPKDFSFDQEVLQTPAYRKVHVSSQRYPSGLEAELILPDYTGTDTKPNEEDSFSALATVSLTPPEPDREQEIESIRDLIEQKAERRKSPILEKSEENDLTVVRSNAEETKSRVLPQSRVSA